MAKQIISITIKLLQGDLISLDVPVPLLTYDLYLLVQHALPQDIRPKHLYQIHLLSEMSEDSKEKPRMEDPYPLVQDQTLCVILDPAEYRLTVDYIDTVYQTVPGPHTPNPYEKWRLMITRDTAEIFYTLTFYVTPDNNDQESFRLYRQDMVNVLPRNHFREDETFQVPDHVMSLELNDLLADLQVHDSLYILFHNELHSEWNNWRCRHNEFLREYIPELDDYADLD